MISFEANLLGQINNISGAASYLPLQRYIYYKPKPVPPPLQPILPIQSERVSSSADSSRRIEFVYLSLEKLSLVAGRNSRDVHFA